MTQLFKPYVTITVSIDFPLDSPTLCNYVFLLLFTYKRKCFVFVLGFESDPGNRKDSSNLNMAQTNPFHSSSSLMNCCWTDENNLWTPGTLIDTNSSFCSAYLESSRVAMEYEVRDTPEGEVSEGEMLKTFPDPSIDLGLSNVEAAIPIEDDVFF